MNARAMPMRTAITKIVIMTAGRRLPDSPETNSRKLKGNGGGGCGWLSCCVLCVPMGLLWWGSRRGCHRSSRCEYRAVRWLPPNPSRVAKGSNACADAVHSGWSMASMAVVAWLNRASQVPPPSTSPFQVTSTRSRIRLSVTSSTFGSRIASVCVVTMTRLPRRGCVRGITSMVMGCSSPNIGSGNAATVVGTLNDAAISRACGRPSMRSEERLQGRTVAKARVRITAGSSVAEKS
jgi:hypothetical protein